MSGSYTDASELIRSLEREAVTLDDSEDVDADDDDAEADDDDAQARRARAARLKRLRARLRWLEEETNKCGRALRRLEGDDPDESLDDDEDLDDDDADAARAIDDVDDEEDPEDSPDRQERPGRLGRQPAIASAPVIGTGLVRRARRLALRRGLNWLSLADRERAFKLAVQERRS